MGSKNTKGLFIDTRAADQPQDTYPFGKNGVQNYKKLAIFNEPGFTISSSVIPYTVNGVIETDTTPIVFSTDDTNSAIGFFDPVKDTYVPIFNDTARNFKLGFKRANYITGEYQKDRTGAYIAVFTDKVKPFRYINCSNPNINKEADILFFLRASAPKITIDTQSGGQLPNGSYVVYVKYARVDGSETPYLASSQPIVVSGVDGSGLSSESISITLTGCDPSYDYVVVGVLKRNAGVTTAEELDYINLTDTVTVLLTGDQQTKVIDPAEIIVPPASYSTVGTVTQLNDHLYMGNLGQLPSINYQKYAGLIQVRWTSRMIDMGSIPRDVLSGLSKGFAHGESYALYIRLNMTDGSKSRAFPIAGRAPLSGEQDVITVGGVTAKRYQINDTVVFTDSSSRTGAPGLWLNQDETYPDTADYDSSTLGGTNLRNAKVRHHKMPTHNWIAKNFNSGDSTYGRTHLDILGIQLSGIVIPADIRDIVDSYEILYAKRTTGNMTVLGQSQVYNAAQDLGMLQTGGTSNFVSSGGNWNTIAGISARRDINNPSQAPLHIKLDRVRLHPFELLFNKIEIPQSNCYLQLEYKMHFPVGTDNTLSFAVDPSIPGKDRRPENILPVVYNINTFYAGITITPTNSSDFIRGFKSIQYAPNSANLGEWNNRHLETAIVGQLTGDIPSIAISEQHVPAGEKTMKDLNVVRDGVHFEETFMGTLRVLRNNVYLSFLSQSLIRTGQVFSPTTTSTTPIYAGDTFPCDYCFNNYGWTSSDDGATGLGDQELAGVKVMRRTLVESTANINSRYEIAGNIYSRWWPHNSAAFLTNYLMPFSRSIDSNQFGYSKDLNSLNEFESVQIFNPFEILINSFPDRIHRGGKFRREGLPASWRTLLPLDYYDVRRDRGAIVNLAGLDDNLLIHLEAALIVTQDKTTLKGDVLSVTLGTADIFQYAPLEALGTKLGYAGAHQDLACVVTPLGYVFIDNISGQIFVFKGTLKLLNDGLNTFFKQYAKVEGVNPYIGNGISIGYDPDYNRALITVKNLNISSGSAENAHIVPGYEHTQAFFSSLSPGVSVVYNPQAGAWVKFMGVNTTIFDCPPTPASPTIANATFTINEDLPVGSVVGQLVASDPQELGLTYLITSGNQGSAFNVDEVGRLVVNNSSIDAQIWPVYTLNVRVINTANLTGNATVTVNINTVIKPPTLPDYTVAVLSGAANGTVVNTEVGTDPNSLTLAYSIVAGNGLGVFAINSVTGVVTIADNTNLNFRTIPSFAMIVQVTNGTYATTGELNVTVTPVYDVPTGSGQDVTILDSTPGGTIVMTATPPQDFDTTNDIGVLNLSIVSETIPGAFTVGFDPLATDYFVFTMAASIILDPAAVPVYTIVIRAANMNDATKFLDLTYHVTVLYDPATLISERYTFSCIADTRYSSDYLFQAYTRSAPTAGVVESMQAAYPPDNSRGYTYAYKSVATGHTIYSLFFLYKAGSPGFTYPAGGFGDYIIARLTNAAVCPATTVLLSGYARGKIVSGYIDTAGNIHLSGNDLGAIYDATGETDNTSVIRLYNLTYASEFTTEGRIV